MKFAVESATDPQVVQKNSGRGLRLALRGSGANIKPCLDGRLRKFVSAKGDSVETCLRLFSGEKLVGKTGRDFSRSGIMSRAKRSCFSLDFLRRRAISDS